MLWEENMLNANKKLISLDELSINNQELKKYIQQESEITIGSDYFTIDYCDYAEVERFNKMFDLNINATNEPSDKDKPKVVEKVVEKEVVKVEYVNVVVVPPTYKEIITEKYDFYKKLL